MCLAKKHNFYFFPTKKVKEVLLKDKLHSSLQLCPEKLHLSCAGCENKIQGWPQMVKYCSLTLFPLMSQLFYQSNKRSCN